MRVIEVVHLVWIDSQSTNGWTKVKKFKEDLHELHAVGMLIHQDKEKYVLAVSYDESCDSGNAIMEIPRKCVKKVNPLCAIKIK